MKLFIPLKTEFFEEFENGTKDTEYRPYGLRWNERTCAIGREVVLSHGYGKKRRLHGVVIGFEASYAPTRTEAWRKCYGDERKGMAACIRVALMGRTVDMRGAPRLMDGLGGCASAYPPYETEFTERQFYRRFGAMTG